MSFRMQQRLVILSGLCGLLAVASPLPSWADTAAQDDHKAALQDKDIGHDERGALKDHNKATQDVSALEQAKKNGNTAQVKQDRAALKSERQLESGKHTLADQHRAAAASDIKHANQKDQHSANVQDHDVRHDQHEAVKDHDKAAQDRSALEQAKANGTTAQVKQDRASLESERQLESDKHTLADQHRAAAAKDISGEEQQ